MTIPKRAIEKALENDWRREDLAHFRTRMVRPDEKIIVHVSEWNGIWYADFAGAQWPLSEIALDRTFWESLGKALGWNANKDGGYPEYLHYGEELYGELATAHHFLDAHFAGTTDVFWAEIIPDEK